MNETRVIKTDEELKIFSDPYRLRIISTYQEQNKPLTVKGVADLMGEVPAKVHYHVKKLLAIDILELDHVEVIKGIHAKYYRLRTENFTIDYTNAQVNKTNLINSTETLFDSILNEFRKELHESVCDLKEDKNEFSHKKGVLSKDDIYLNKEEYEIVHQEIINLFQKYKEKGSGKKKFSFFAGIIEKKES